MNLENSYGNNDNNWFSSYNFCSDTSNLLIK